MTRHFLDVDDLTADELVAVLDLAEAEPPAVLARKSVGLYFAKPSLRTRHSCESAVAELGGAPITFGDNEVSIGTREPVQDVAAVLAGYHAAVGARVFDHQLLVDWAAHSSIPVVNLLSDTAHPCQVLADLLTMRQHFGKLEGLTVAWIGDFNNVAHSLALGCALTGVDLRVAAPPGYGPSAEDLDRFAGLGLTPFVTTRPHEAAEGADAVHTDVFTSMGQEAETEIRAKAFEGMQVDDSVLAAASARAVFMHCLPAHRGEEVTASVVDGDASLIIQQAHNRKHSFRGLLLWLLAQ